jgi:hypothetical protein
MEDFPALFEPVIIYNSGIIPGREDSILISAVCSHFPVDGG